MVKRAPHSYETIDSDAALVQFCDEVAAAPRLAFDTEFVSEDSYRPHLCLVQAAIGGRVAIIDPLTIDDLTPFWRLVAEPTRETIVHAGREEFRFILHDLGQRPGQLYDLQLAAALIGLEYPAAYGTLVSKVLGKTLPKGETRTDWRRRPLSQRQLEYAAQDVLYLEPLRDRIHQQLEQYGRVAWLADEMEAWQAEIEAFETRERWRRVKGITGLSARSLAILRELWRWRDAEAARRNSPPKRVLRDDLMVELARRQSADPRQIRAIRGMERGDLQRQLPNLAAAIATGMEAPDASLPRSPKSSSAPPFTVLGQLFTTALASVCRQQNLAPGLVATVQDVRDLIAARLAPDRYAAAPPVLSLGWRAEVVGDLIDQLLAGKLAIAVGDPLSENPLTFEPRAGRESS